MLEEADLQAPLKSMKDNLMDKNVAADIAEELIRGVSASLVGRKLEMLGRVSTAVRTATEATLQRILSPVWLQTYLNGYG